MSRKIEGQELPAWWEVVSHSGELGQMANAMASLLEFMPVKSSFQQGVAFMILAAAHARNEPMSVSEMVEAHPHLSNAIRNGYVMFTDDLKWLQVSAAQHDKRKKVLKLTEAGTEIVAKVTSHLGDA